MIKIRRVYDEEETGEHYKVYVDRLWPRGISKENTGWDEWIKDVSPSNELRKWFNHEPAKWEEFKKRFVKELASKQDELKNLKQLEKKHGTITLLYSAKNEEYNNAVALREILMNQKV